jgi:N-acetylated-alpha-linked acidic dipeptidase
LRKEKAPAVDWQTCRETVLVRVSPYCVPFKKPSNPFIHRAVPNGDSAIATSRLFARKPHLAGSPQDFQTAKDFLALLHSELGIEPPADLPIFPAGSVESRHATLSIPSLHEPTAWIDVYYPVLDKPLDPSLEIIGEDGEIAWTATLKEESDDTDPEAGRYKDAIPTWHGSSRAGEVVGKLVHVNYGTKKDYDDLVAKG